MGLFGNKQYDMPTGQPATWSKDDVKHWVKHIGMGKHKAAFRVLNGQFVNSGLQQLLSLTEQDIVGMCKQDLDARYVYRMLLRVKGEPEQAKVPPAVAAKERAVQYLFQWAGEDAVMSDFREFLDGAGTVTVGLMTAAERMANNTLGRIVGMVFKIYKSSRDAQVNIYNCRILRYLCVDILRAFHSAGTDTLLSVPAGIFEEIQEQLHKALMLVRSCSKPGWLVRMAYAGKIDAEFSSIHTAAVEMLQEHELNDLYGHAKLPQNGDYTDCCMALQESLRGIDEDVKAALTTFAETGEGYESIKTALSCDDEGLKSEMGYIPAALAVIERMLPKLQPASPPAAVAPVALAVETKPQQVEEEDSDLAAPVTPTAQHASPRAVPKQYASPPPTYASSASPKGPRSPSPMQTQPVVEAEEGDAPIAGDEETKPLNMYELFLAFCNFGTRAETSEMDGAHFVKFCRDSKLIGKGLNSTDVDLLFARVKLKGQRRIVYEEFVEALTLLAEKKGVPLKELTDGVLARGGPIVKATTRTTYTRLHDDRSTYTGVYARGGPTNVDERISLDKMVMRSDPREVVTPRMFGGSATPRGTTTRTVGSGSATSRPASGKPLWTPRGGNNYGTFDRPASATPSRTPRGLSTVGPGSKNGSPASAPRMARNLSSNPATPRDSSLRKSSAMEGLAVPWKDPAARAELLRVYTAFTEFGHSHAKVTSSGGSPAATSGATMENKQFVKLVKDAGLLGGALTVTRLDIIFSKVRVKGQRKVDFAGFERALTLLADERGYTLHQVYNAIVSTAGPQLNHVTTPEFVKYHDDRSTYTGVYARGGPTNVDKQITLEKMVGRNDDIYVNSRTPRFVA